MSSSRKKRTLKDDIGLLLEETLPRATSAFFGESVKKDSAAYREAYVEYLKVLLEALDEGGLPLNLSMPLAAHIAHLKDLNNGHTADYLKAKALKRKPQKSKVLKYKELFIATALNILMFDLSEVEASKLVSSWCSNEGVALGGRTHTPPDMRVKRIRDEIAYDPAQKAQYLSISQNWMLMGATRKEASLAMVISVTNYDAYVEAVYYADKESMFFRQEGFYLSQEEAGKTASEILNALLAKKAPRLGLTKNVRSFFHAFNAQDLEAFLKKHGIEEIHLVGFDINDCVLASAYGAIDRGYYTYVIEDLCHHHKAQEDLKEAALIVLRQQGMTKTAQEIKKT